MNCYSCDTKLMPVFTSEDPESVAYQFENSLWVTLDGGYGMFTDPIEHELMGSPHPHKVAICHECAHALCVAIPWIEKLINSYAAHAHRVSFRENHPEHYGWDYDKAKQEPSS